MNKRELIKEVRAEFHSLWPRDPEFLIIGNFLFYLEGKISIEELRSYIKRSLHE